MPPFYPPPPPIAYAPSNDGAKAVLALPPDELRKNKEGPQEQLVNNRRAPNRHPEKQLPIGGYDDDYEDIQGEGYVGHAGYKKRNNNPLISSIKENVRKDVHKKPPTYTKPKDASEEDNSVRFPDEKQSTEKYEKDEEDSSEEISEEVVFPDDRGKSYRSGVKYLRNHDDDHVYSAPKNAREHDLVNHHDDRRRKNEKERTYPDVPNRTMFQDRHTNPYPQFSNNREPQRYSERAPPVYTTGIQSPEKLLRNIDRSAYPQLPRGKLPTVSEILDEVTRFPQRKHNKAYLEAHQKTKDNKNQNYPDLQQYYHLGATSYGQRGQRDDHKSNQQSRTVPHQNSPRHQQGHIGDLTPLLHLPQQQSSPRGLSNIEQLQQQRQLEQLQQQQRQLEQLTQQQNTRNHQQQLPGVTPLEQLQQQQQTKPPFSPVVLLSRGPPTQTGNQAVDVWYTRQ